MKCFSRGLTKKFPSREGIPLEASLLVTEGKRVIRGFGREAANPKFSIAVCGATIEA